ncbi:MAG: class I SAM-dependent methyltransferase [Micropruina sp.]|uniref:class I SAM-dependent methyltransferase n=1 Tax=Micropruina sp. TaxID=2737536 RepID=UPI0039E5531D
MDDPRLTNPLVVRAVAALNAFNAAHPWDHNERLHGWILRNLPARRERALDVGCGRGVLLAKLADRFAAVHGTDIDAAMREASRHRCAARPHVVVDGAQLAELDDHYDLITMVAVLHHLDPTESLREAARLLTPGGRLLVVGLAPPTTPVDLAWEVASLLLNPAMGFIKHPRRAAGVDPRQPVPVRDATVSLGELRRIAGDVLPGAVFRRRLFFRHTIRWTKPG